MFATVRDELRSTLQEIKDAGLFKAERVITTPQSSNIRVGTTDVLNLCASGFRRVYRTFVERTKTQDGSGIDPGTDPILHTARLALHDGRGAAEYVKHVYGPYAANLNHLLQRLEGHYVRGHGDRSRQAELGGTGGSRRRLRCFVCCRPRP